MLWKGKKQATAALFTSGYGIVFSLPMGHLNSATYMFKRSELLAKRLLYVNSWFCYSIGRERTISCPLVNKAVVACFFPFQSIVHIESNLRAGTSSYMAIHQTLPAVEGEWSGYARLIQSVAERNAIIDS